MRMERVDFTPALRMSVQPATARLYEVVPVRESAHQVVLALAPMRLLQAREDEMQTMRIELRLILGKEVEFVVADREQMREYVRRL
jgi:type II secretion system (T2SS) protein E